MTTHQFKINRLVITFGAENALEDSFLKHDVSYPIKKVWQSVLERHQTLDKGALSDDDHKLNFDAIKNGNRIFSVYLIPDHPDVPYIDRFRVYVITEADRSVTTILLPEEY